MSKQTKNKILIILFYLISLFLFEFIIGDCNFEKNAQECVSNGDSVFALFAPYGEAGFYHFIFISCIAIYVKFSKKIDIAYKHIIYWFPLITFIFSLPMGLLAAIFENFIKML